MQYHGIRISPGEGLSAMRQWRYCASSRHLRPSGSGAANANDHSQCGRDKDLDLAGPPVARTLVPAAHDFGPSDCLATASGGRNAERQMAACAYPEVRGRSYTPKLVPTLAHTPGSSSPHTPFRAHQQASARNRPVHHNSQPGSPGPWPAAAPGGKRTTARSAGSPATDDTRAPRAFQQAPATSSARVTGRSWCSTSGTAQQTAHPLVC